MPGAGAVRAVRGGGGAEVRLVPRLAGAVQEVARAPRAARRAGAGAVRAVAVALARAAAHERLVGENGEARQVDRSACARRGKRALFRNEVCLDPKLRVVPPGSIVPRIGSTARGMGGRVELPRARLSAAVCTATQLARAARSGTPMTGMLHRARRGGVHVGGPPRTGLRGGGAGCGRGRRWGKGGEGRGRAASVHGGLAEAEKQVAQPLADVAREARVTAALAERVVAGGVRVQARAVRACIGRRGECEGERERGCNQSS